MIGSDGKFSKGFGHPRGAGAFPRVLGSYVRERCVLNFYEAVDKMTIMPARRLHLKHKGRLCEGAGCGPRRVGSDKKFGIGATFAEPAAARRMAFPLYLLTAGSAFRTVRC
jgi:N-acyl-D-amino-acid deacylase